jgi:hypothetical protein
MERSEGQRRDSDLRGYKAGVWNGDLLISYTFPSTDLRTYLYNMPDQTSTHSRASKGTAGDHHTAQSSTTSANQPQDSDNNVWDEKPPKDPDLQEM